MKIICDFCGDEMKRRPCEVKEKNYCSRKCLSQYLASIRYIDAICKVCDKEFKALVGEINRGKGDCCSISCASKLKWTKMKRAPVIECKTCGNVFQARTALLNKGKGLFCSNKCYGVWSSENNNGEKHPFYIKREERNCILCSEKFMCLPSSPQSLCSQQCASQYATSHNVFF